MPARRSRKSKKSSPQTGIAVILILAVIGVFLGYSAWQDGELPEAAGSALKTTIATIGLPTVGADFGLPSATPVVYSDPGGELAVYFTNPLANQAGESLETALVGAINAAQRTVDVAVYNISNENLGDALVQAHRRGVRVRMVMESEAMDRIIPAGLQAAGIPIAGDQGDGLMHNKFIIIDGRQVWMGSANFTDSSFFNDSNNMLQIQSEQLAQNYQVNFEEMFVERRFGAQKQPNTPYPNLVVGDIPFEVYFSPDDGVAGQVVEELRAARSSIHFLAYSYTRDDFAEAMIDQSARGVRVRGVFDAGQNESNTGGEYARLQEAGLDVRLDGFSGLLHDKMMVIDQQVVITGSYNFSANAERNNDESIVIIRDPALANQYLQHFERAYEMAK